MPPSVSPWQRPADAAPETGLAETVPVPIPPPVGVALPIGTFVAEDEPTVSLAAPAPPVDLPPAPPAAPPLPTPPPTAPLPPPTAPLPPPPAPLPPPPAPLPPPPIDPTTRLGELPARALDHRAINVNPNRIGKLEPDWNTPSRLRSLIKLILIVSVVAIVTSAVFAVIVQILGVAANHAISKGGG